MPESKIPQNHPLRLFFMIITERNFNEKLNWSDSNVTDYISNLLTDFTMVDQLYAIRDAQEKPLFSVSEMLMEGDVFLRAKTIERERETHRHIGDYILFMTGIFPEYLKRLKFENKIEHPDFMIDYIKMGKKSYRRASEFDYGRFKKWTALYRKLSENFEVCITGLGLIKNDLNRFSDWQTRRAILS